MARQVTRQTRWGALDDLQAPAPELGRVDAGVSDRCARVAQVGGHCAAGGIAVVQGDDTPGGDVVGKPRREHHGDVADPGAIGVHDRRRVGPIADHQHHSVVRHG